MFLKRLIFILLAAIGLLLPTKLSAVEAMPKCTLESIDHNSDRPQWSDLGMEDILPVSGQSNITPPSPVQLASQGRRLANGNSHSAGVSPVTAWQTAGSYCIVHNAARLHASRATGYIYIIQRLRL